MNVTYKQVLSVPKHTADSLEACCQTPHSDVKKYSTEFDEEVEFANGLRMAVQVCGPGDPSEEPCWTQGVLFDKEGNELGTTDCGESFLGEYCVSYNGDDYLCVVSPENNTP